MIRSSIIVALAAASFSISSTAAVYRWVDSEGHVHYTDKALENAEPVNVHTGQPKGTQALPAGEVPPSGNLTGEQLAQKKSECEQKKKQHDSYKTATKIVETDSLGRQHEYTADEI